jgi:hypothetical protein
MLTIEYTQTTKVVKRKVLPNRIFLYMMDAGVRRRMPKQKVKNPAAVALSARRMVKMTAKRRREVAQQAARARWNRKEEKTS